MKIIPLILICILSLSNYIQRHRINNLEKRISQLELNQMEFSTRSESKELAKYWSYRLDRYGHIINSISQHPTFQQNILEGMTTDEITEMYTFR
ncbi:MAG: hypothetical protein ACOC33_02580 [bacterium]